MSETVTLSDHLSEKLSFSSGDIEDEDEGTENLFLSHLIYWRVLEKSNVKYFLFLTTWSEYDLMPLNSAMLSMRFKELW